MSHFEKYASVILDVAVDKALDYGIPEKYAHEAQIGARCEVPIRGRLEKGYITEIKAEPDFTPVKPLRSVASSSPLITKEVFELAIWMAKYYCTPLRQVFKTILPACIRKGTKEKQQLYVMRAKTREELRKLCEKLQNKSPPQAAVLEVMLQVKKGTLLTELLEGSGTSRSPVDTLCKNGYLDVDIVRVDRSPLINEEYFKTSAKKLHLEQAQALEKIQKDMQENRFKTHLLFGVTGSGKTEVYLQAIEQALKQEKTTIMLVPEISLTPQTIERFRSRFDERIAILHHRLSQGERLDEWQSIHRGEARIIIGARSAIFSPVSNLGLIIVDEEHEASYKSEEMPCYHARDIAVMRAMMTKAVVILGSATPSLESYHNAQNGKFELSTLSHRAEKTKIPKVTIVDMQREFEKNGGYTNFSEALLDGIKKRQERGEQSLLFLNRRGYHTSLLCKECSYVIGCPHCDTTLTFHKNNNIMVCHLCGFKLSPPPVNCPECHAANPMKYRGVGTEQVERSLHAVFPDIRTIRMDGDTTRHKGSHQKLLKEFKTGKADVLIGTQMIAKGLHFPEVTLVGIINSDGPLNMPDFRASEQAFQLITQVAGRAGRALLPGEVIIQSCLPNNNTIKLAAQQDYLAFYDQEIGVRKFFSYPPYTTMVRILCVGDHEKETAFWAEKIRSLLIPFLSKDYQIHPILPAGIAKVKDQYRFHFYIRGPQLSPISNAVEKLRREGFFTKACKVHIDINPLNNQ